MYPESEEYYIKFICVDESFSHNINIDITDSNFENLIFDHVNGGIIGLSSETSNLSVIIQSSTFQNINTPASGGLVYAN